MKTKINWMIFLFLGLIARTSQGQERRDFYNGIRGQAMGGCSIATVNDETALLLNPAGLGKLRDFYGTILDPELDVSTNVINMYKTKAFTQYFDLDRIQASLDAKRDTYYHARGQFFPSFVGRNFGIGVYSGYLLDAKMAADGTSIEAFYHNDQALVLGYNFRFYDGRIKFGFNAKVINRIEYNEAAIPITDVTAPLDLSAYKKEGTGVSYDAGLILTAPWNYLPTLAVVARDVGSTKFDKASGVRLTTTDQPATVAQDVDVALAIFPIHAKRLRSAWTIQYDGILTAQTETDAAKRYHFGMEVNFGDLLFLRGGYNQRYWTAGLELASEHFQLQLASYGEEIGTVGATVEDRRYATKLSFRF